MDKTELIKRLILKEQNVLKLKKKLRNKKNNKIEDQENKTTLPDEKRLRLINQQLLAEIKYVFGDQYHKIINQQYFFYTGTSMETTHENVSSEKNKIKTKEHSPRIQSKRLNKFLTMLKEEKQLTNCQKSVKKCVSVMNSSTKGHWTLPITTMRAIKDCILNRRWENLTHILLILIKLPTFRYQPLVRHLCHVMDKLHPVVQENDLQGQLSMVQRAPNLIKKR